MLSDIHVPYEHQKCFVWYAKLALLLALRSPPPYNRHLESYFELGRRKDQKEGELT